MNILKIAKSFVSFTTKSAFFKFQKFEYKFRLGQNHKIKRQQNNSTFKTMKFNGHKIYSNVTVQLILTFFHFATNIQKRFAN